MSTRCRPAAQRPTRARPTLAPTSYPAFRALAARDLGAARAALADLRPARRYVAAVCGDPAARADLEGARAETLDELFLQLARTPDPGLGRRACVRAALAIAAHEGPWSQDATRLLRYLTRCEYMAEPLDLRHVNTLTLQGEAARIPQWAAYVSGAAGEALASAMLRAGIQANHLLGPRRDLLSPSWRARIEAELCAWSLGFSDPLADRVA
ncbi:MAG: hypothetical protein R3F62_28700 [Planctomycetota bacterium]